MPTEIAAARTANSNTTQNPDGSLTTRFGTGLNTQTSPGVWVPASFGFTASGTDLVAAKASVPFRVSDLGVEGVGSVSHQGIRLLTSARPVVSGMVAAASVSGTTWVYSPTRAGLEVSSRVTVPQGPRAFSFAYDLLGGASPLQVDSNGALVSGAFRIERPVIIAAGTRFYPAGQWSISGPGSVSFAWDDSILPLDAYPYTIDPALSWPETGFVGNDAWDYEVAPGNPPSGGSPALLSNEQWGNVALEPQTAPNNIAVNELLAWNTATTLSRNAFVTGATLTVQSCYGVSANALTMAADWDPYSATFAASTYLPLNASALTATAIGGSAPYLAGAWNATGASLTNCTSLNGGGVNNPFSIRLANPWAANPNIWPPSQNTSPSTMLRFGVNAGAALTGTNQWLFMTAEYTGGGTSPPLLSVDYFPSPYNVTATGNADDSATVAWSNPTSTAGGTISRNMVEAFTATMTNTNLISLVSPSATSAKVTNLAPGVPYYFYVFADYANNNYGVNGFPSDPATTPTVTVAAATPPTGGPIGSLEQLGGCTCGYATQDSLGNGVDAATGNYSTGATDISIPGRGPTLSFSRTYNSLLAGVGGPLGNGWTGNDLMSLSLGTGSPPVTVTVNQETGSQATFTYNGSSYIPAPRVLATLALSGGVYTFTRRGTQSFKFDSSGKLSSYSDPNANTISLGYSSGKLATVSDAPGRTLHVNWTGSFITSVAFTATETVTYGYDTANANLTDVGDVGGGNTHFTYSPLNHLLVNVLEPDQSPTSTATTGIVPTLPTGSSQVTNTFDAQHRLTSQSDLNFAQYPATTFDYSTYVSSTAITDPKGLITLETSQNGELTSKSTGYATLTPSNWTYIYDPSTAGTTSVTDPNGHASGATYDPATGNKLTSSDALTRTTHYANFNSFDEPQDIGDPLGVTTTYTFDASGNVTAIATPVSTQPGVSQTVGLSYSGAHNDLTAVTDPRNNTTRYGYDLYGDVTQTVDAANDTTNYSYDSTHLGRRMTTVSPRGYTTSYTYDAFGDLLTQTDPNGHLQATNTYTSDRNLLTSKDANSAVTSYLYDGDGQLLRTTLPGGAVTRPGYDGDHNITSQQEANGHVVTYGYEDPAFPHKPTSMSVLGGSPQLTSYVYDAAGNLVSQARGTPTLCPCVTNTYDAANELSSATYAAGTVSLLSSSAPNITAITYDTDGQRTTMAVAGQTTATWAYDSLHRVTATKDGAGATVSYGYDLNGNVTALTYPSGASVARHYDAAGRLDSVTDTVGAVTHYSYDADSTLQTQSYPNATTATVTPDRADQIVGITDTSTAAPGGAGFMSFTYTRGPTNQVTQTVSTGVVPPDNHTFNYTADAMLAQTNDHANSYDQALNLVELASGAVQTFNNGDELTTSNDISRVGLVTATDAGGSGSLSLTLPVSATVNDQVLVSVVVPGTGSVTTPAGYSVVTTTSTGSGSTNVGITVLRHTVAVGDSGTLTVAATAGVQKAATAVIYRGVSPGSPVDGAAVGTATAAGQVTPAAISASVNAEHLVELTGGYTTGGTWAVSPPTMTVLASPSTTNLTSAVADGVQVATGTVTGVSATVTNTGDLVAALLALRPDPAASSSYTYRMGDRVQTLAPGVTTTMLYDPLHRLTSYVSTTATSSSSTAFTYFGDGSRATKATAGVTTNFTWDQVDGTLLSDGTTLYVYGLGGVPLEQVAGTVRLFYHQDQLGSTRALTNVTGTVVAAYSYDANGNPTVTGTTGATPFGFTGQYRDAESGFVYLGRYYDPATGQYVTRDPAYAQRGSAYGYAGNDPVNQFSPNAPTIYNPPIRPWLSGSQVVQLVATGLQIAITTLLPEGPGEAADAGIQAGAKAIEAGLADAAESEAGAGAGAAGTARSPDFIVHPNGEIVPVPEGAVGPSPVETGKGLQFTGGSGGNGLDPRVTDIRIMDPVTTGKYTYPEGYVSYGNGGQTVNPWTGRTVSNADPWAHWPWSPR